MFACVLLHVCFGSHPAWDEWIEICQWIRVYDIDSASHPAWDEWIEIRIIWKRKNYLSLVSSRLGWVDWNLRTYLRSSADARSHPAWDEWIEIWEFLSDPLQCGWSHPAWDEWIEIFLVRTPWGIGWCLIPLGMSGLKLVLFQQTDMPLLVSSRLGWVDWNKHSSWQLT